MQSKPAINTVASLEDLQHFYWDMKELRALCRKHGLSTQGIKSELIERISLFLQDGTRQKSQVRTSSAGPWDSDQIITRATLVINYKNDSPTRVFFLQEIGPHFHFNAFLRQFAKAPNHNLGLTYGDLVDGWLDAEAKQGNIDKKPIDPQFAYNQFQRDYFAAEPGKTRRQCLAAWRLVRSVAGPATYTTLQKLREEN